MANSIQLASVAGDRGFRFRVAHFLAKKSLAVLADATPDANELALAKLVAFPATPGVQQIVESFARLMVSVDQVETGLSNANFDHLQFTDSAFETQVNALWPDFAKGVS